MHKQIKLKSESAQLILNALIEAGAHVQAVSTRFNLLKIEHQNKNFFIKGTAFPVNSQPACIIANNKFLTKKILKLAKILTPKSYLVQTFKQAKLLIIEKNLFPCVVKPASGSHGDGVYANIESIEELEQIAQHVFPPKGKKDILIEQYIKGKDYRVLVVGDKVSAVMERVPAHVIGDGVSTLKQLISKFNKNPLVGKKYEKPMCKIHLNGEVKRILNKQGINLGYIPKKHEQIFLRQNANISTGGIGKDATEETPPIVAQTAIQAAKAIGMKISGVDIMYDDLAQKAYVLELNNQPGIDIHHFPVVGRSRNVAKDIADYILETSLADRDLTKEITLDKKALAESLQLIDKNYPYIVN